MAFLTTSEKFARSYDERGLQPFSGARGAQPMQKSGSNGVRNVEIKGRVKGASRQIAGNTVRAAGVGMQAAGKGAKRVGKTTTKAGARLTATGIGAIVGVPLMAIGGTATGMGAGAEVAGKQVSRAGKRMTKKNKKVLAQRDIVRGFSVQARAVMTGMFYITPILLLGIWEILLLGLTFGVDAVTEVEPAEGDGAVEFIWKGVVGIASGVFDTLSSAVSALSFGTINLEAIVGALHPGNFFAGFYVLTMAFCWMTLLSVWFVYELSGSKPLSGNGAGAKQSAFLLALCLYCVPIVHIFPWFFVWTAAVAWKGK